MMVSGIDCLRKTLKLRSESRVEWQVFRGESLRGKFGRDGHFQEREKHLQKSKR